MASVKSSEKLYLILFNPSISLIQSLRIKLSPLRFLIPSISPNKMKNVSALVIATLSNLAVSLPTAPSYALGIAQSSEVEEKHKSKMINSDR